MNILLVEPPYKRDIIPLGLMKISAYHKQKKDNVAFTQHSENVSIIPDIIYVTSMFTWDYDLVIRTIKQFKKKFPRAEIIVGGVMASLIPKEVEKDTGVKVHVGIWDEVENIKPDYTLFKNIDYTIGFTTRGCVRKCGWCPVWRIEDYKEIKDWHKNLDLSKKRIVLMDNNFTASSDEHFFGTIKKLRAINKTVDFNQSVDCRLIDEKKADAFASIKIKPFRISFDSMKYDGDPQRVVKMMKERGIKSITVDVLYNYDDTPEDFWYRLSELCKLDVDAFPMRYQPLTGKWCKKKSSFIGKHYNQKMMRNIRIAFSTVYTNGCLGAGSPYSKFEEVFGKTGEEFKRFINLSNEEYLQHCKEIRQKYFIGKSKKLKGQKTIEVF